MIRAQVLQRDNHECHMAHPGRPGGICRARANQVDHIIPASRGGSDDQVNLRALCWPCHRDLSSSQGGQAFAAIRRRMKEQKLRPQAQHPGLVRPGS
jgi:5-methylcytosine-specific restriction protein A